MEPSNANPTLVIILTWLLTWLVGKFLSSKGQTKLRGLLPAIAFLMAIGLEVAYSAITSEDVSLSWGVVLRALGEAGTAVIAHSQFREIVKTMSAKHENEDDEIV